MSCDAIGKLIPLYFYGELLPEEEDRVEAIVLAGTELPLLLRESGSAEIEFLDTTVIHVEAVVDQLLR